MSRAGFTQGKANHCRDRSGDDGRQDFVDGLLSACKTDEQADRILIMPVTMMPTWAIPMVASEAGCPNDGVGYTQDGRDVAEARAVVHRDEFTDPEA